MSLPILYSFRRCPYAMRARLALSLFNCPVNLREIVLKHKPQPLLEASAKGTVPVLIFANGDVIDESLEIMLWAQAQFNQRNQDFEKASDKEKIHAAKLTPSGMRLITQNDTEFKPWLDKYKYSDRFPEHDVIYYRQQGEVFIQQLESLLATQSHLIAAHPSLADYAIFPFVRQFAHVDKQWFESAKYPNVQRWLAQHLQSPLFKQIMQKYPTWLESQQSFLFGD